MLGLLYYCPNVVCDTTFMSTQLSLPSSKGQGKKILTVKSRRKLMPQTGSLPCLDSAVCQALYSEWKAQQHLLDSLEAGAKNITFISSWV